MQNNDNNSYNNENASNNNEERTGGGPKLFMNTFSSGFNILGAAENCVNNNYN